MTIEEKRDLLILALSALKTAVLLTEQAVGSSEALELVGAQPTLNAISGLTRAVNELSPAESEGNR